MRIKRTGSQIMLCSVKKIALFCALMVLTLSLPLQAQAKKAREGWVKKNGYYYFYQDNEKLTGYQKIKKKYYLFDSQGRQQTGWRRVGKKIRYFKIENGKKGSMVTDKEVNHIRLNEKGIAVLDALNTERARILLGYQQLADRLVKPGDSKKKKLVRVFKYARNMAYRDLDENPYQGQWDVWYAGMFLDSGYGNCITYAVGFAYLANAVGYKDIIVRNYDHGHCEIGGLIYDPAYAKNVSDSQYKQFFGKTYEELPTWRTGPQIVTRRI